jgi:3-hydroxyisobutyrate dehydrogenase
LKLINNFRCGVQLASLPEGLARIEQSGLDRAKALAVLKSGAPGSPLISAIAARTESGNLGSQFAAAPDSKGPFRTLSLKAGDAGVERSTAGAAHALFDKAV